MAEQYLEVIAEPGHGVLLGQGLHRLPLVDAALNEAAMLLVKVEQLAHRLLATLLLHIAGRIFAAGGCAQ